MLAQLLTILLGLCVCQTIMRQGAVVFNRKAKLLTKYLRVVLEPIPYAILGGGHRGFWRPTQNFYARDGTLRILIPWVRKNTIVVLGEQS